MESERQFKVMGGHVGARCVLLHRLHAAEQKVGQSMSVATARITSEYTVYVTTVVFRYPGKRCSCHLPQENAFRKSRISGPSSGEKLNVL